MSVQPYQTPQPPANQPRNLGQLIANLGPQSKLVEQSTVDPRALAAGIKPGFASINFKGKTWGIRWRGVTNQLLARGPQGEILGAIPTIDIVILKSAAAISKAFYIDKFKEGSFAPPDCWSTNGQVPDLASAKKQSDTCRGCKWDAFGSRTMDDGRKGKACSDNKRVAVVPATDLRNEAYGGPMLLKLTPSAFNGLSELENQLHLQGYRFYGVVMRLNFDYEAAFPKVIFTPVRVLSDEEVAVVIEMQAHEMVERILSEELVEATGDPNQPEQHAAPVTPVVTPPVPEQPRAFDPGVGQGFGQPTQHSPTGFAQPTQAVSPDQQRIAALEAALAAAKAPPPPPPPPKPVLTPEQQKIADLEAQLAAARQPAVTTKPPRATRKRTQPVTPAETGPAPVIAMPDQTNGATHVGNGAAAPEDNADVPADLDSRIDSLLNTGKPAA